MATSIRFSNHTRGLSCALAAALGGLVYLNALDNPFVYDDFRTVVDNGSIASLRDLSAIVLHEVTRPLTNLSLAFDRALWGDGAFGFHLTNLLLHLANVMLVFHVVAGVSSDRDNVRPRLSTPAAGALAGGVGAVLFAVHPLMTEAVGYVSGRADLLCATLLLTAFLFARRWMRHGGTGWYLLVWAAWLAALLTKETAAVLPLIVLAYSMTAGARGGRRRADAARLILPLLAVMLAAGAVRWLVWSRLEHAQLNLGGSWLPTTVLVVGQYVRLLCIPAGQSIFHAAPVAGAADARVWVLGALMIALFVLAWQYRIRAAAIVFGACWFGLTLAPSLLVGGVDGGGAVAEHRLYLPAVGFVLLIGAVCEAAYRGLRRFRSIRLLGPLAFASIALMLSGRTYLRNMVWDDPVNLWQEAALMAPSEWLPQTVLGESLHAAGRHEEASAAFRRSLALRPDNETTAVNLAVCLSEVAREREASGVIDDLEQLHPSSPYVPVGRGSIAMIAGRHEQARPLFLEALTRDPANVMALQWLAIIAQRDGDRAEALHRCYQLQRLTPGRLSVDSCIQWGGQSR